MNNYEMFKNRILNGKPFLKVDAEKRVESLINNLEITQEQADELMAIIEKNGRDILPQDAMGRLARVEDDTAALKNADEELVLAMADVLDMVGGAI